jgi:hypothetical protein
MEKVLSFTSREGEGEREREGGYKNVDFEEMANLGCNMNPMI